jgi:hypothetical protein
MCEKILTLPRNVPKAEERSDEAGMLGYMQ